MSSIYLQDYVSQWFLSQTKLLSAHRSFGKIAKIARTPVSKRDARAVELSALSGTKPPRNTQKEI